MLKLFIAILFDENGSTLSITRVTANTLITATATNNRADEIEAVVNALTADNLAADSVSAVKLNVDCVRAGYGLVQHTDGSLYVDVSDTNPSLEISDGGLRAKVYGLINRTSDGLTWGRTGDVLLSSAATTPDGFSDVSATYANKFIRISATALSTGGADTHSHTLTESNLAAHTHSVTAYHHYGSGATAPDTISAHIAVGNGSFGKNTSSAGSSTAFTGDNVPAYMTLRMMSKN